MKVLQVIDKLNSGGAERICVELSNLLAINKVSVSVLSFLGEGELDYLLHKQVVIEKEKRSSKYDFGAAYKIALILKKYDLIHVHMRHNFRYIQLIAKLFNVKSKIILHDHFGEIKINKKVPLLLNGFLKPYYYIGVSEELTDWAYTSLGIEKQHIFLLSNIVGKQSFPLKEKIKEGYVCIGNIKPTKNQLFAIQLVPLLKEDLTIYGKVQDVTYFKLLKEEIIKLGIKDRVTFVHDELNIQAVLGKYKLALQTSKSESGPLVLIEFLAQSLPFVAYKTGAVSTTLEAEFPGLFLDNFDQQQWVQKIKFALNSSYNFEELYYKHFNPKNYLDQCLKIYLNIINS